MLTTHIRRFVLTKDELLDQIDEAYNNAMPVSFSTVEDALKVAGSALKWLTDQCEDEDGPKDEDTD